MLVSALDPFSGRRVLAVEVGRTSPTSGGRSNSGEGAGSLVGGAAAPPRDDFPTGGGQVRSDEHLGAPALRLRSPPAGSEFLSEGLGRVRVLPLMVVGQAGGASGARRVAPHCWVRYFSAFVWGPVLRLGRQDFGYLPGTSSRHLSRLLFRIVSIAAARPAAVAVVGVRRTRPINPITRSLMPTA
jgi:hypothetical protein